MEKSMEMKWKLGLYRGWYRAILGLQELCVYPQNPIDLLILSRVEGKIIPE